MTARRLARVGAAAALAAAALLAGGGPALASGELEHEWASDSVHLRWDGSTYAVTTTSFLGMPVAVPGDRATRTVRVTNGGPSRGVLEAWIVDVELVEPRASRFFDDLTVDWRSSLGDGAASMRALATAGSTRVDRTELEPGESTLLTVGYELPGTSTAGNRADDGVLEARLDVLLRIEGAATEGPDDGGPDDGEGPDDGPDTPDEGDPDDGEPDDGAPDERPEDEDSTAPDDALPRTGAALTEPMAVVAGLLGLGVVLILAARRRRREQG